MKACNKSKLSIYGTVSFWSIQKYEALNINQLTVFEIKLELIEYCIG